MAKGSKRKVRRHVAKAVAHIKATFNNTIVTITDVYCEVLCWASAGTVGFKGTRKSTPFAAQRAGERCGYTARKFGMMEVEVRVKGPGGGRDSAIAASRLGLQVELWLEPQSPVATRSDPPEARRNPSSG